MILNAWCQTKPGTLCLPTNVKKRIGLLLLLVFSGFAGRAQVVTLKLHNEPLAKVFKEIEKQTGFAFIYGKTQLDNAKTVDITVEKVPLKIALDYCFMNQELRYYIRDNKYVVIVNKETLYSSNNGNVSRPAVVTEVTGRVTDEKDQPLVGVTVRTAYKPTSVTKIVNTDQNGDYKINVPDNTSLEFSFIGFQSKNITVKAGGRYNVVLEIVPAKLDELVITGYTAKSAKELTGSVQKVTGDQLRSSVTTPNALSMLKGKTTGLYITETTGEAGAKGQVIERGQSSMATARAGYIGRG